MASDETAPTTGSACGLADDASSGVVSGVIYVLADHPAPAELTRLRQLERAFDPFTMPCLDATGIARGWRCLEVGAGAGSVAAWMAHRVGPTGSVDAVDLDTGFIAELGRPVQPIQGDILRIDLDTGYQLVHTRAVLVHVPERDEVVERLVAALAPGGFVVLEEPMAIWRPDVIAEVVDGPVRDAALAVSRAVDELFRSARIDLGRFPLRLPMQLERLGLDVQDVRMQAPWARGGSAWSEVVVSTIEHLAPSAVSLGLATADQFAHVRDWVRDPANAALGTLLVSVTAHVPR